MDARTVKAGTMEFTGTPVSPGIAIAQALRFKHLDLGMLKDHGFQVENVTDEISRLERAIAESADQVGRLQAETHAQTGEAIAEIFKAHAALLKDRELLSRIRSLVLEQEMNAEYVLANAIAEIESQFSSINEEHLQVRLLDIQDVLHRLLRNLLNIEHVRSNPLRRVTASVILVAENLLPSDLTLLDLKHIAGIALEEGSAASHVAIMARSMRVPAVFRITGIGSLARNGMPLIVDGFEGRIIANPLPETSGFYRKKMTHVRKVPLRSTIGKKCTTKDGVPVSLLANAASIDDVERSFMAGAEGIGLFRTEFYYMSQPRLPTIDDEFAFYKHILSLCGKRPLTLRLLDLGAEKTLPYLGMPPERNPQLGLRGIRFLLSNPDLFRNHLTSIVRASAVAPLQMLIPFVSSVEEIGMVHTLVHEVALQEGVDRKRISIGIMIEIPSVLFSLSSFMTAVDFLSVGTNDLMQYTFAVDRDQGGLERYRRNAESVVCRIVGYVAAQAMSAKKEITVCGEMAGDPRFAAILAGLGIKSLSMQPDDIAAVGDMIAQRCYKDLVEEARQFVLSPLNGALFQPNIS